MSRVAVGVITAAWGLKGYVKVRPLTSNPDRFTAGSTLFVKGKPRNEATAAAAGEMAIEGAQPLRFNAYKVPLMRNLVKRAIRGVEEWTTS